MLRIYGEKWESQDIPGKAAKNRENFTGWVFSET